MIIYIHKCTLCIYFKVKVATTHNSSREVQKGLSRNNIDIFNVLWKTGENNLENTEVHL